MKYYTEPKPCTNCGKLSNRLSKALAKGFEQAVCDSCRNSDFRTCCICHRHRKVHHQDDQNRSVCVKCATVVFVPRLCSWCGKKICDGCSLICKTCGLQKRIHRRVALNTELLEQTWVRSLFEGFCAWEGLLKVSGNITARIDTYALFFKEIDNLCEAPSELTQHWLFHVFGGEGLRRGFLVIKFLCEQISLKWDSEALESMIETRRISEQVEQWRNLPWFPDLKRYVAQLMQCDLPPLKRSTVRMYQRAAANLLSSTEVQSTSEITQGHLDRFLKRHSGQSASLSPFMRFLRDAYGVHLMLKKKAATSISKKDRELVLRTQMITRSLVEMEDSRNARALLAKLISDVYQVPLKRILELSSEEVRMGADTIVLWPATQDIRLEGQLAALFRRWLPAAMEDEFVFCGRNGVQPLSYSAVRYYLQKINFA